MVGPVAEVLGPVRLPGPDGVPAVVPGALARRLVVALALAGREGRSAAALADDVWGDDAPRNPRAALQMLVSRLRAATADELLASTPAGYRLAGSDLQVAEAAPAAGADAALALWRGTPGADVDEPALAEPLAERADRARVRLLTARAEARLAAGDADGVLADARALAALRPLDGAPVALRMRALADSGRPAEALAAFAEHRERLADELGADPDPDVVALHARLLRAAPTSTVELVGVRTGRDALLGRDADLAELDRAVGASRLVTVLGPGGLGKTRIAHEVAQRVADRFARVVFVELAGTRDADDVALAVGQAAGARGVRAGRRATDPPVPDLASRTVEALTAARTMLVLDNCEHVVDAAAALADDLLAAVPDLAVLTTSRVPLLVPGEHVHPLPPLRAHAGGADLFRLRARAARPGVRLDADAVDRVVGHLDGLPLAIELAAARLRSMTLEELEARLDDRFALLVGGSRTAPERHRTLFAVIEWSWRLLPEPAQRAAALLGAFPDGFTAESAADLLGEDAEPLTMLLVDQSLLTFSETPTPRYRMLETVREFALAAADRAGLAREAAARLDAVAIAFAARTGPGLTGGAIGASSALVAAEEETLRILLRRDPAGRGRVVLTVFALLSEYWLYRGEFETVVELLPVVVPVAAASGPPPGAGDAERAERIRALAVMAAFSALPPGEVPLRVRGRLAAEVRRAPAALPPLWGAIAGLALSRQLPDSDSPALAALIASPDPAVATLGASLRAQIRENAGRLQDALDDTVLAERLAIAAGLAWFRFISRTSRAQLLSQAGDPVAALRVARVAEADPFLAASGAAPAVEALGQLDWVVAVGLLATGELEQARLRFQRVIDASREVGRGDGGDLRAVSLAGLAEVAAARGDRSGQAALWAQAAAGARRGSVPWAGLVRGAATADAARRGDRGTAVALYRRLRLLVLALIRLGRRGWLDRPMVASAALGLSAVLAGEPGAGRAADALGRAAMASGARLDLPTLAAVARGLVAAEPADGDPIEAIDRLLRSRVARL